MRVCKYVCMYVCMYICMRVRVILGAGVGVRLRCEPCRAVQQPQALR